MTIDTNLLRSHAAFLELSCQPKPATALRQAADELDALRAERDSLQKRVAILKDCSAELGNISNAPLANFSDYAEFYEWAKSRARYTLGKARAALEPHPLDTLVTDTHHEWEKP